MLKILLFSSLAIMLLAQSCSLSDSQKIDCGYMGIDKTKCEMKGCCWVPVSVEAGLKDTPWCFYPSGQAPCGDTNYKFTGGQSFTTEFINKMHSNFMANINIDGKGGVAAAPDKNTPGGSYYYHWMRDAGLTMRGYQ